MYETRRILVGSLGSLLLVFTGLFLVCAVQKQATRTGPADEEAYKRELVELLGLQEELGQPAAAGEQKADTVAAAPAANAQELDVPKVGESAAELFDLLEQLDRLRSEVDEREQEISKLEEESATLDEEIRRLTTRLTALRTGERLATASAVSGRRGASVQVRVSSGVQASVAAEAGTFRGRYDEALRLFHERRYSEARAILETLLREQPDHPLADNCQYWIGECLFGQSRYLEAVAAFSKVFAFDATDKYDDAQIMIALSYMRMGIPERAKAELLDFLKFYPRSEYVATARSYLNRLST